MKISAYALKLLCGSKQEQTVWINEAKHKTRDLKWRAENVRYVCSDEES